MIGRVCQPCDRRLVITGVAALLDAPLPGVYHPAPIGIRREQRATSGRVHSTMGMNAQQADHAGPSEMLERGWLTGPSRRRGGWRLPSLVGAGPRANQPRIAPTHRKRSAQERNGGLGHHGEASDNRDDTEHHRPLHRRDRAGDEKHDAEKPDRTCRENATRLRSVRPRR